MAVRYFITLFIAVACMTLATNVSAQHNILHGDTLILNNHEKFWLNEEVVFGTGTLPNRAYSYIYEAPNGLQKLVNDHKKKLLPPAYKGYKSKIVKFEKEVGHNKKDYDYTILVLETADGKRFWCDIDHAYNNHEIVLKASDNGGGTTVIRTEPNKSDADFSKKKSLPDSKKTTSKPKPKPVPIF